MSVQTKTNRVVYIYGLYDISDKNKTIRYVGKTVNLKKRLKEHKSLNYKPKNIHKINWIKKVLRTGSQINYLIIEECSDVNWEEREIYWIGQYTLTGKLTNIKPGGSGGKCFEITYEQCKKWVNDNLSNIDSRTKWSKITKKLPDYIPKCPNITFQSYGWKGWGDFLNTDRIQSNKLTEWYLNYEDAKNWINKNIKIESVDEWVEYVKNNEIPNFIPNRPDRFYKNKNRGWKGWGDFLGTQRISAINQHNLYLSYQECKEWVNKNLNHIKTVLGWEDYCKNNLLPKFIPKSVDAVYKDEGWEDWGIFFNSEKLSIQEKTQINKKYKNRTEKFYRKCPKCNKVLVHKNKSERNLAEKRQILCSTCTRTHKDKNLKTVQEKYLIFDKERNDKILKIFEEFGGNWLVFSSKVTPIFRQFKREDKIKKLYRHCPECKSVIIYTRKSSLTKANKNNCLCFNCKFKGEINSFYGKKHRLNFIKNN